VSNVLDPGIRQPEALENMHLKKQLEMAEAGAEEVEFNGLNKRVDSIIQRGVTPDRAYDIAQVERGKATGEVRTNRFDGLTPAAEALGHALAKK
jgi:hypothetical protein